EDRRLTIGHVGDTRLYKVMPGLIVKLTHDHSPVGEQEDQAKLSEIEAMNHPRRNEIFREVGTAPRSPGDEDFIELIETRFDPGESLILCSDGLTDAITQSRILKLIRQNREIPEAIVRSLINAANEAGGSDNVTAIFVTY